MVTTSARWSAALADPRLRRRAVGVATAAVAVVAFLTVPVPTEG